MYVYIDGDNIGMKIEQGFIDDNEGGLANISSELQRITKEISCKLKELDHEIIFSAADGILCKSAYINRVTIETVLNDLNSMFTFSAGIGDSLEECYIALRYAKSSGRDRVVIYTEI